jgi:hypothetical protein
MKIKLFTFGDYRNQTNNRCPLNFWLTVDLDLEGGFRRKISAVQKFVAKTDIDLQCLRALLK